LDKLEEPNPELLTKRAFKKKNEDSIKEIAITEGLKNLDEIDVGYGDVDNSKLVKEFNITDAGVKDRWSRFIGAMGMEAVAKQANAKVFLSG